VLCSSAVKILEAKVIFLFLFLSPTNGGSTGSEGTIFIEEKEVARMSCPEKKDVTSKEDITREEPAWKRPEPRRKT
jgi:hypothetical protein